MENLLNCVIEITNILITCLAISIVPVVVVRLVVKLIKMFTDFVVGNNRVRF